MKLKMWLMVPVAVAAFLGFAWLLFGVLPQLVLGPIVGTMP